MVYSCVTNRQKPINKYCQSRIVVLHQHLFLNINQLDALNFYNKFISSLYMFRAHVLIVRRAKFYYTVSGIITLKQLNGLKLLNN